MDDAIAANTTRCRLRTRRLDPLEVDLSLARSTLHPRAKRTLRGPWSDSPARLSYIHSVGVMNRASGIAAVRFRLACDATEHRFGAFSPCCGGIFAQEMSARDTLQTMQEAANKCMNIIARGSLAHSKAGTIHDYLPHILKPYWDHFHRYCLGVAM